MATYFKGEQKLVVSNLVDVNMQLIVPSAGNGTYNVYTMPAGKFGLFQLLQTNLTGSGSQSTVTKAKTRGRAYSGVNEDIKTFQAASWAFGIQTYDAQKITFNNNIGLDPFTYLRTLEALEKQAELNAYCALLGPGDFVNVVTNQMDPDNVLYMSYRAHEIDIF